MWRNNPEWPNGLEPDGRGNRRKIYTAQDEERAREICTEWNVKHKPGRLVRRASYMNAEAYKKSAR